ncbi:MAG: hypothetical protein AAF560_33100 [Acidobacteriota bacterium]
MTLDASPAVDRAARANPFRVSRVLRLRYRLGTVQWRDLLARLAALDYRGALVGPKGSGKTTLLEDLEQRLTAEGWRIVPLRLSAERSRLSAGDWRQLAGLRARDLVTVDGVEQLGAWSWRRLAWRCHGAGGLVVTSHSAGRLPTLRQHHTDPGLLLELVAELVGPIPATRLRPRLEALFERHHGNLRDCLRSLYDAWAAGELEGLASCAPAAA